MLTAIPDSINRYLQSSLNIYGVANGAKIVLFQQFATVQRYNIFSSQKWRRGWDLNPRGLRPSAFEAAPL
jgi:hypothetical protein